MAAGVAETSREVLDVPALHVRLGDVRGHPAHNADLSCLLHLFRLADTHCVNDAVHHLDLYGLPWCHSGDERLAKDSAQGLRRVLAKGMEGIVRHNGNRWGW